MGFITDRQGRYICEVGAEGCTELPAIARLCPHGWCQHSYICPSCWEKNGGQEAWNKLHAPCEAASKQFKAEQQEEKYLLQAGHFVRVSALQDENGKVKVWFKNIAGQTKIFLVDDAAYEVLGHWANVTEIQFREYGEVIQVQK